MNKYLELHLENIEIPESYMETVTNEGIWEHNDLDTFSFEITEGTCYLCDLNPFNDNSEDMKELNNALQAVGFEVSGYGWQVYLCDFIEESHPDFISKVGTDSESGVCGIYVMDSLEDYKKLLSFVSEAIRDLLSKYIREKEIKGLS